MLEAFPVRFLLMALAGWVTQRQQAVLEYLVEENRVRAQLRGRRLRLTDDDRRCLAVRGRRLGRRGLAEVASIVTPDTILRWHRQLIARKWTTVTPRPGRPAVCGGIRQLIVRMATENPTWGYTRIQGALKNLHHRVARSTIAKVLNEQGMPPVPERSTPWRTFLRAHWGAIAGADFFTTEVWTARGLVTYYTLFVIELASRKVQIAGCTPHPDEAFMLQVCRQLTAAGDGALAGTRVLLCDRDSKWSRAERELLASAGVQVIRTPYRAPNANAHAERFVRSVRTECLDRVIPLGERHFRQTLQTFVEHYHHERNHQGRGNRVLEYRAARSPGRRIRRRERLGGLLSYYYRAA